MKVLEEERIAMKTLVTSVVTVEETAELIRSGKRLSVAGDERLLQALPRGQWVGGTIPYFMSEEGGLCTHERLQVAVLPDFITEFTAKLYSAGELSNIPADYKANGFSRIVIPAFSEAHRKFAEECSNWPGIFDRPLVGWIAGVDLKDLGKVTPKVVNGVTGEMSDSKAIVLHVNLPAGTYAKAHILNLFRQGEGATITFTKAGFSATDCLVDGEQQNLAKYLTARQIDTKLPLVADYMGAMINVSFEAVDAAAGKVEFYAPVFPGVEYKIAAPVSDYEGEFTRQMDAREDTPFFSCNCILNYLYANLEGKKTGKIVGPMTFGEIAYMLLNQTLVYLTFESK